MAFHTLAFGNHLVTEKNILPFWRLSAKMRNEKKQVQCCISHCKRDVSLVSILGCPWFHIELGVDVTKMHFWVGISTLLHVIKAFRRSTEGLPIYNNYLKVQNKYQIAQTPRGGLLKGSIYVYTILIHAQYGRTCASHWNFMASHPTTTQKRRFHDKSWFPKQGRQSHIFPPSVWGFDWLLLPRLWSFEPPVFVKLRDWTCWRKNQSCYALVWFWFGLLSVFESNAFCWFHVRI